MAAQAASILSGKGSEAAREALEESAQLARTSASARARVAGLRARGASLPDLDSRLAAADLLAKQGEPQAAQRILEEVLVLANALVAVFGTEGPIDLPDPIDARIDRKLGRVLEKASEAARARTDELLASARLAEKIDEAARARAEELLASARLSAKIEEVTGKHAEEAARGAVEALLGDDAFKRSVDARARARAEEAFASVKAGASPEAIEAAAEKALARREKDASQKLERLFDPEALERRLVPLVASLVKSSLQDEQAVQARLRSLVAEELAKDAGSRSSGKDPPGKDDDERVRRLVVAEIVRREAMAQAHSTGEGLTDRATAIARSDAMQQVLAEQFSVLRSRVKAEVVEELERLAAANRKKASESRLK